MTGLPIKIFKNLIINIIIVVIIFISISTGEGAVQVADSGKNNETYCFQFMLPDNGRLYYLFYLQSDI